MRGISKLDDVEQLIRVHQARIRRFVTYSTGDPDLAAAIRQDTLLDWEMRGMEALQPPSR